MSRSVGEVCAPLSPFSFVCFCSLCCCFFLSRFRLVDLARYPPAVSVRTLCNSYYALPCSWWRVSRLWTIISVCRCQRRWASSLDWLGRWPRTAASWGSPCPTHLQSTTTRPRAQLSPSCVLTYSHTHTRSLSNHQIKSNLFAINSVHNITIPKFALRLAGHTGDNFALTSAQDN